VVDDAVFFQALQATQAGRGREGDVLRKFDVGNAAVLLQHFEDAAVGTIEFDGVCHIVA